MDFFPRFTKNIGPSPRRQLMNLIMMRERKEGQIRALKFCQRTVNNQLSREFTELYGIQDQIKKLTSHLDIIDEDIRSFLPAD